MLDAKMMFGNLEKCGVFFKQSSSRYPPMQVDDLSICL